jgi:hypothetical protein
MHASVKHVRQACPPTDTCRLAFMKSCKTGHVPTCMILREEGTPKAVSERAGRVGWYPLGGGGGGQGITF